MRTTTGDIIYKGLNDLRGQLPALREALQPGTRRRWQQRELSEEAQTRMSEQARADRETKLINLTRGITSSATGRAPLRIDVLDALGEIEAGILVLEAVVCDHLAITPLERADSGQRITRLVVLLGRICESEELAARALYDVGRMTSTAARALGDVEPVHRIDARCPICDALSLRAFPDREVVVCVNDYCRCAGDDCPCHDDPPRRHRWYWVEWPWLAQLLGEDLGAA